MSPNLPQTSHDSNTVLLQLLSQPSCGNSPNCPDAQLVSHSSIHKASEGSEFHKNILLNIWQGQVISVNIRFYWHSTISHLRMRKKKTRDPVSDLSTLPTTIAVWLLHIQ